MANESLKIYEIVTRSVNHTWSIPEFQRGFVWKSTQIRDLAESLWLNYPVGSLLVWNNEEKNEERNARDAKNPSLWLVDGQQRSTALSIIFGRKPFWWDSADNWNKILNKYDLRFDIDAKQEPYFVIANAAMKKRKDLKYIKVSEIINLDTQKENDQSKMQSIAREVKIQGLCDGMDAMEVFTRLDRLRKIREKDIMTITIDHEIEDVVEIFSRLNSKGTKVTEADIYLGIVASKNPGWVRDTFLPYLKSLEDIGFDVSPNLLFKTLTGIGFKRVKFKTVPDSFWENNHIIPNWKKTTQSWSSLLLKFKEYGILSNELLPTESALITLLAFLEKFPDSKFEHILFWFLQASRYGRYSGSSATALEEDLKDINDNANGLDSIKKLLKRIDKIEIFDKEDFLKDYSDSRFGRLILYLLIYRNKAIDWGMQNHRIGFDNADILSGFKPQWHHIFPKKYLEDKIEYELINSIANIAVIGPAINIRISAKKPMEYIQKYNITETKLTQQFIENSIMQVELEQVPAWLNKRAEKLSLEANGFFTKLSDGIY